ncbi:hypothetical protein [Aldersonia kunmingensis]|uniref:hypothetical protein n=1 Tax=Aldersonia kunmingensis TaxID=408066 RepID=UPI00082AA78F|nr:hypothetical protein [Aldersonia kunmingensis]
MITQILAQNPTGPEFGKASPIGLVIVLLLLVGLVLLIRSMNKQLRKLPDTFEPDHPEQDQAADEGTDRFSDTDDTGQPKSGGTAEQKPNGNDTAGHGTDR